MTGRANCLQGCRDRSVRGWIRYGVGGDRCSVWPARQEELGGNEEAVLDDRCKSDGYLVLDDGC